MTSLLDAIVSPERPVLAGRSVIVVAHPDDETLACGALLARLSDLTIVHVADGPGGEPAARAHGFENAAEYTRARRAELVRAVALAGAPRATLISLNVPDQGACFALAHIACRLRPLLEGSALVLTHAFEGGHPDHDAVAWAVQAALAQGSGEAGPLRLDMPLYRAGPGQAWVRQRFASEAGVVILTLDAAERARKAAALAAYASQSATLGDFGAADESYRVAPRCDFTIPIEDALYERCDWGVSARCFAQLAAAAQRDLAGAA